MPYINPIPSLNDNIENISINDESDYIQINEVYFAFIDVLGFKKNL